jgi:hypothetical protein
MHLYISASVYILYIHPLVHHHQYARNSMTLIKITTMKSIIMICITTITSTSKTTIILTLIPMGSRIA